MINPNNLSQLASSLSDILDTPVSIKILEQTTEKQRSKLVSLIWKWKTGGDYEEAVIRSILDYGKNKLKPREYSDKTKHYLQDKKLI